MARVVRMTAKNPSEARGIRKALRAVGATFEFKTAGKRRRKKAKRNPAKKKKAQRSRSKSRRRR